MAEPFVGEIRMFAGNFAPRNWAFCDGQLLAISQNDALFSLFGTFYGGDGRTTFGLPDLRGRIPIHAGSGPGLTPRALASKSGLEQASVNASQLPVHGHAFNATSGAAADTNPVAHTTANSTGSSLYGSSGAAVNLNGAAIANAGGGQVHENVMPYLCVHFIVALFGFYPS
jgi:microcystin-dependent protein